MASPVSPEDGRRYRDRSIIIRDPDTNQLVAAHKVSVRKNPQYGKAVVATPFKGRAGEYGGITVGNGSHGTFAVPNIPDELYGHQLALRILPIRMRTRAGLVLRFYHAATFCEVSEGGQGRHRCPGVSCAETIQIRSQQLGQTARRALESVNVRELDALQVPLALYDMNNISDRIRRSL
ncbi:hypothetical protein EC973_001755 [Apophysomyces ossiformis]|uniref:Uncharacterized protein n=1 Tax=Apophysomyces ossiformis TaxID=679940 RepID=A0A8H7ERP6_9FUNG|nr:hypothetical protein EC973_001755 [Apophysomyces ossiformis]